MLAARRKTRVSRPTVIMGMGSDEVSQLGFGHPDDAENLTNIPPSFLPWEMSVRIVRAGGLHSMALSKKGIPYTWGCNDDGTLGRVTSNENEESNQRIPAPVTGFVRQDGTNEDGKIKEIAAGASHSLFLSFSGAVYMCGFYKGDNGMKCSDQNGPSGTPLGTNKRPVHVFQMPGPAKAIYAGASMNAAVLEDNSLVTWGTFQ